MNGTRRLVVLATAILVLNVSEPVSAGFITATLNANPSTINEGGSTGLTLTLTDTPYQGSAGTSYYSGGYTNYVWTGAGSITSFSGSLVPGDGQNAMAISGTPSGTTATATESVQYLKAGTFTASVGGTVVTSDQYEAYDYNYDSFFNFYYLAGSYYGNSAFQYSYQATTQIHVNNVSPTITQINWVPTVLVGQDFAFSATATDPGLAGGEQLTFAYDFSGGSNYLDFVQTGGTSDGGTYHFDTTGDHLVNIRVTDSNGGMTYGNFHVDVLDSGADNPAPEPSSLAMAGTGALIGLGYAWRRRRKAPRAVAG